MAYLQFEETGAGALAPPAALPVPAPSPPARVVRSPWRAARRVVERLTSLAVLALAGAKIGIAAESALLGVAAACMMFVMAVAITVSFNPPARR